MEWMGQAGSWIYGLSACCASMRLNSDPQHPQKAAHICSLSVTDGGDRRTWSSPAVKLVSQSVSKLQVQRETPSQKIREAERKTADLTFGFHAWSWAYTHANICASVPAVSSTSGQKPEAERVSPQGKEKQQRVPLGPIL